MSRELNPELMNVPQTGHMKVHSKILKDLSSGIYSNPANAIKELIINSYDASASKVTIRAKPDLDSFTIIDDGIGMNCDDFENKFAWISHSEKRRENEFSDKFERPLVGKFGIGFISASQLCNKMTVISSKAGEKKKFRVDIDFSRYKGEGYKPDGGPENIYDVSQYNFINLEEEIGAHYTIIILSELSREFIDILTDKEILEKLEEMDEKERKKNERIDLEDISFEKISEIISLKTIREIEKNVGTYWQFVFDIANTVPVPYLPNGPLNIKNMHPVLKKIVDDIKKYDFSVEIDGIDLRKPIILPNSDDIKIEGEDFDVYFFEEKQIVDNKHLKFRGYFYNQKNRIIPVDFQGVLVRVRNVSIGKADRNFLNYPWMEKLWMAWTFGEIYVDEGLEDSLNINRNSFVINHPHYMYIQRYIHNILHDIIFKRARARYEERKEKTKIIQAEKRTEIINNVLQQPRKKEEISKVTTPPRIEIPVKTEVPIRVEIPEKEKTIPSVKIFHISQKSKEKELSDYLKLQDFNQSEPVVVDNKKRIIILNDRHNVFKRLKKKDKESLEEILTLFEISLENSGGNINKLKQLFFKNLEEWRR
ncbi:MAG: hypothetical protein FIB07_00165 [Candidatus Methanoperedens sp.]|nr:hypothetical protein [Candidatus Methanoperedens sp.]